MYVIFYFHLEYVIDDTIKILSLSCCILYKSPFDQGGVSTKIISLLHAHACNVSPSGKQRMCR